MQKYCTAQDATPIEIVESLMKQIQDLIKKIDETSARFNISEES